MLNIADNSKQTLAYAIVYIIFRIWNKRLGEILELLLCYNMVISGLGRVVGIAADQG